MIFIIKKVTNIFFLLLILFFISCSDDFKSVIKTENETAGTGTGSNDWIKIGDIATPRAGAAVALEEDWLYIYGGETYSDIAIDDFWKYNLSTGEYEILTSNGDRAYATLVNLNGELYLFGGKDTSGTVYDDKIMYFYSDAWANFTNSNTNGSWPVERSHHIAVPVCESGSIESIYFHGGKDDTPQTLTDEYIYELDIMPIYEIPAKKRTWSSTILNSYTRSEHSAVFYNGSIFLFGGYDNGTYYNDLYQFNISTEDFSEVSVTGSIIIPERSGISMIEHNGRFYVFGGTDGADCLDDLWYYSSGSWTKISTAPFKRAFYSAVKYNNSLIVFGGYFLNDSSQKVYSSEIWEYNLD